MHFKHSVEFIGNKFICLVFVTDWNSYSEHIECLSSLSLSWAVQSSKFQKNVCRNQIVMHQQGYGLFYLLSGGVLTLFVCSEVGWDIGQDRVIYCMSGNSVWIVLINNTQLENLDW